LSTSFVCVTPTPRLTLFPYTTLFRSLRLDVVLQRPGTDGEEARGNDLLAPLLVRRSGQQVAGDLLDDEAVEGLCAVEGADDVIRSEEHTSELQSPCNLAWSPCNLVCRLLLEKKKELVGMTSAQSTVDDAAMAFPIVLTFVDDSANRLGPRKRRFAQEDLQEELSPT